MKYGTISLKDDLLCFNISSLIHYISLHINSAFQNAKHLSRCQIFHEFWPLSEFAYKKDLLTSLKF